MDATVTQRLGANGPFGPRMRGMTVLSPYRTQVAALALGLLAAVAQAAPGLGDMPPPDIGHNLAGDEVRLTRYTGKAVIVTFWATWCGYCLKELPVLDRVQVKAGKDQMAVIAVNTEDRDVFRRATRIMRNNMQLELVSDASGDAQKSFGVKGIPHMVIIGRDGRILNVYTGYSEEKLDDIVADINKALRPLP
jgi:thiol-disulfide isomerase/thioredoxin